MSTPADPPAQHSVAPPEIRRERPTAILERLEKALATAQTQGLESVTDTIQLLQDLVKEHKALLESNTALAGEYRATLTRIQELQMQLEQAVLAEQQDKTQGQVQPQDVPPAPVATPAAPVTAARKRRKMADPSRLLPR